MKKLLAFLVACSVAFCFFSTPLVTVSAVNAETESEAQEEQTFEQQNTLEENSVCSGSELPSHYVTEKQRFSLEESVVVSYKINFSTDWDLVEYGAQGFEILSIVTDSESMTATITLDIEAEMEEACLTITNAQNTNKLYGIKTERGYFISKESRDNLWDAYFYSGVEDGLYSMQEYIDLMNDYYGEISLSLPYADQMANEANVSSVSNVVEPSAVAKTVFSGNFSWIDDDGNAFPLRFVKVEVYDNSQSSSPSLLFTTYTNINGRFTYSLPRYSATSYKAKIYSVGERVSVQSSNGVPYVGEIYVNDILNSDRISFSASFDMSTVRGQAMQISQAALFADRYAKEMNTTALAPVTVCYPCPHFSSCCYDSLTKKIHILPETVNDDIDVLLETYSSWDVIMHEYGHHVMYEFGIEGQGGYHTDVDLTTLYGKLKAIQLAWGEAYPTVFSELVQQYFAGNLAQIDGTICNYAHNSYNGLNFEYGEVDQNNDISLDNDVYGEARERALISLLWDLFDQTVSWEPFDTISFTHQEFWNVIPQKMGVGETYSIHCFSDFSLYFLQTQEPLMEGFSKLLSYYRIAPSDIEWVQNNDGTVTIQWLSNGSVNFPHDDFYLFFYNAANHQHILGIQVPGTTSGYILSESQLDLLKTQGEIYFFVSAAQTTLPRTGSYPSEWIYITFSQL